MVKNPRPISCNINGDSMGDNASRRRFMDIMGRLRPNGAFVLNNLGTALEMTQLVSKGSPVIFRAYDPFGDRGKHGESFDNQFHQINRDPVQVLNLLEQQYGNHRDKLVFAFGMNEPSHNNGVKGSELSQLTDWIIKFAYAAKGRGFRLALGEIATDKSIEAYSAPQVQNGAWDSYIRMLDDLRGWHIPTFHSYASYTPAANAIIALGGDPLDRDDMHPDNWPKAKLATKRIQWGVDAQGKPNMVMPPHYNIGRELLLTHVRAGELGLAPIPYWITECFIDAKTEMPRYEEAKNRFRWGQFDSMRGMFGHWAYWAWIMGKQANQFTANEFSQFAFACIEWMVETHPNEAQVFCPFAANTLWDTPQGMNFLRPELALFWELCIDYNNQREKELGQATPPPPMVDTRFPPASDSDWYAGQMKVNHTGATTLVRSTPSKSANNALPAPNVITQDWQAVKWNIGTAWLVQEQSTGLTWMPIVINGLNAWVSAAHVTTKDAVQVNKPAPNPVPPAPTPLPNDETLYLVDMGATMVIRETTRTEMMNFFRLMLGDLQAATVYKPPAEEDSE